MWAVHLLRTFSAVAVALVLSFCGTVWGQTVLTDYYGKWFNFKVVFDMDTHQVSAYVNNCL